MSRLMQQVRDRVFDKKVESDEGVANLHELVEYLVANLVENHVCSWLE